MSESLMDMYSMFADSIEFTDEKGEVVEDKEKFIDKKLEEDE